MDGTATLPGGLLLCRQNIACDRVRSFWLTDVLVVIAACEWQRGGAAQDHRVHEDWPADTERLHEASR